MLKKSNSLHHGVKLAIFAAIFFTSLPVYAADLVDPPVFTSSKKLLDLVIIAKPVLIGSLSLPESGGAWGYEICERRFANSDLNSCKNPNLNLYGGSRLQLKAGDTLKVHLVNQLPLIPDARHGLEAGTINGEASLLQNPTNFHTHGMLVSPNLTSPNKYGDNIFVLTFNSKNPALLKISGLGTNDDSNLSTPEQIISSAVIPQSMIHGGVAMPVNTDSTDYQIAIPPNHPSGLFWFHPHPHGISLNQITAGLSGIITVGGVDDYVTNLSPSSTTIRHLILKDTQIKANNNTLSDQLDPGFCGDLDKATPKPGQCISNDGDSNDGNTWSFTLNGQLYPNINVKSLSGEIWRITNSSASATYDLQLTKTTKNGSIETKTDPMIMQLLSVDGISVTPSTAANTVTQNQIGGAKFVAINCPTSIPNNPKSICVNQLHLMPSARAEVWVVNRDIDGKVIKGDDSTAIFETKGYSTGTGNVAGIADDWPPIDLASVTFASKNTTAPPVLNVKDTKHNALGLNMKAIAKDLTLANAKVPSDATNCQPLPTGWKRRIFFGIDHTNNDAEEFGLGYDLINADGKIVDKSGTVQSETQGIVNVRGTTGNVTDNTNGILNRYIPADGQVLQDVMAFPTATKSICVPLGTGNTPVNERWELINLASEDHNFHIHQTKFRVLTSSEITGGSSIGGVLQDNVPVFSGTDGVGSNGAITDGSGCDGSIAKWRSGECVPTSVTVEIPFAITGDFVYHCHILEHEDGGMMATVHVAGSNP